MKAAVLYGFGQPLVIEDVELDPPGAGEVKVRIGGAARYDGGNALCQPQ